MSGQYIKYTWFVGRYWRWVIGQHHVFTGVLNYSYAGCPKSNAQYPFNWNIFHFIRQLTLKPLSRLITASQRSGNLLYHITGHWSYAVWYVSSQLHALFQLWEEAEIRRTHEGRGSASCSYLVKTVLMFRPLRGLVLTCSINTPAANSCGRV